MREMSVAEQRYRAVLAVISDGRTVTEVAAAVGVSRQSLHSWLGKYESAGLEGLGDGSHRPRGHPRQMPPVVEAAVKGAGDRLAQYQTELTKALAEAGASSGAVASESARSSVRAQLVA